MRINRLKFILIISLNLLILGLKAQQITVELGSVDVALNELFTIKISIQNGKLKSYSDFPEIDGFAKRGTSSSSSTNIINALSSGIYH
jgi:hypothetical protein